MTESGHTQVQSTHQNGLVHPVILSNENISLFTESKLTNSELTFPSEEEPKKIDSPTKLSD